MLAPTDPADRLQQLETCRLRKMARSAHAFVRGSTAQFYRWLAVADIARDIPRGPAVWICGDCHVGNLGPVANAEGAVDIQIRDLDQTVIGNPAHDLIRLALSLASAARGSDLPGIATAKIVEAMIDGYVRALDRRGEPDESLQPEVVRAARKRAMGRRWRHLARERIADTQPHIPLGKHFWALGEDEREAIETVLAETDIASMLARGDTVPERVRLLDAAYWVKGCSSLGAGRYAALVAVETGKGKASTALVDFKQAVAALPPTARRTAMPRDPAERVVAGAAALSPFLGGRMAAVRLLGKPFVLRELRPQDLKIEIDQFNRPEAIRAAHYLAYVLGRAHAAQMDGSERKAWAQELRDPSFGSLDAPPWLWRSVVKLMGRHEAAYLEHCRLYAASPR